MTATLTAPAKAVARKRKPAPRRTRSTPRRTRSTHQVKTIGDLLAAQPQDAGITKAVATAVLKDAGLDAGSAVTSAQRRRAQVVAETQAELRGKARALVIVTGDGAAAPRTRKTTASDRAAKEAGAERAPSAGSTMHNVLMILGEAKEPMTPAALYAEMQRRGIDGNLNGPTPVATIASQLYTNYQKRRYGLNRPEKGKFEIKK